MEHGQGMAEMWSGTGRNSVWDRVEQSWDRVEQSWNRVCDKVEQGSKVDRYGT